ncbi:MAG: chromate transporter [Negativicutes bacterium]|nr:chromate transporter [Negativicutes bacterium]
MDDNNGDENARQTEPRVSLWDIATGYLRISLSSFGGGLSAWAQLIVVDQRKWLTDEEFLSAMALSRVLPGPNQVNLAVYVGSRLRGVSGCAAALAGLIAIPFIIVLLMGIAYFNYQYLSGVQSALRGMAAVAVGMTLGMGLKLALRHSFTLWSILIMAASFITIGVLRWPLIPVLAVLVPLSIWRARQREGETREQ